MPASRLKNDPRPQKRLPAEWDVFLSHSSKDDAAALRVQKGLQKTGVRVWIDDENLRQQGLLLQALQDVLLRSANVVLLWSETAEQSRYVTAEWNFAWNRDIPIYRCTLDDTGLPLGLAGSFSFDLGGAFDPELSKLIRAIRGTAPPPSRPQAGATAKLAPLDRNRMVREISNTQYALLDELDLGRVKKAASLQLKLDPKVRTALRMFADDADILSLAGYQTKNAYQIKHWQAIQERKSPPDPLLGDAEQRFWEALHVRPDDPSALNGLGSILALRGDLDAAEFFVVRALERAKEEGFRYPAAEEDLKTIRREKRLRKKRGQQ
jgi:hypothetical protein